MERQEAPLAIMAIPERELLAAVNGDYRKFRVLGGLEGKKEPYYVTTQSPIDIQ